VKRLVAISSTPAKERTISSQPRAGEKLTVETPTTAHALLEFVNGAVVTVNSSWDVWNHSHKPMELYGVGLRSGYTGYEFSGTSAGPP